MITIFDWDGTLCDSVEHIVAAMLDAAAELSLEPPSAQDVRDIVGLGLSEAMDRLFPGLDEALQGELVATYSRHFASPDRDPPRLFDGAMDTLQGLKSRGIELAVATGKSRRGLDRVLGTLGLTGFFDATRCADETLSKPHPRMLHEIMAERGKAAGESLMIGDSEYDLDMAQRAGVPAVAVTFGVHGRERLAAFEPVAIIDDLPGLLDLPVFGRGR